MAGFVFHSNSFGEQREPDTMVSPTLCASIRPPAD